jgi:hypothetical protein
MMYGVGTRPLRLRTRSYFGIACLKDDFFANHLQLFLTLISGMLLLSKQRMIGRWIPSRSSYSIKRRRGVEDKLCLDITFYIPFSEGRDAI